MYERFIKRTLDFAGASFLLIITSPVFIAITIIVKLTSRGPAIFKQERTGLNGELFTMRKFRSMAKDNDVHDAKSGDKVTKVGKILRATSLDELPQLINVLRGDMSFIGPRPWIPTYYEHMNLEQRRRNNVRPGITGLAQAYGRNNLSIHEKINYDVEYVDNMSLRGDLKVIFVTVKTLFDHEAHELGKGGIHEELDVLRSQNGNELARG
ncbi:sugar transferase [Candidatus Saccharibacteria bacterium TM7i]|nr:sugar transferase [Candidatus Saccharibacteria bacterium TM7i]